MRGKFSLTVQYAVKPLCVPTRSDFRRWLKAAWVQSITEPDSSAEITIRVVGGEEGLFLNQTYRQKAYATNVLTFGFDNDEFILPSASSLTGDIILCAPIIEEEAQTQNKSLLDHYAHLVVHGMLHLQGYDHLIERDALQMEALEIDILRVQGIANPYSSL